MFALSKDFKMKKRQTITKRYRDKLLLKHSKEHTWFSVSIVIMILSILLPVILPSLSPGSTWNILYFSLLFLSLGLYIFLYLYFKREKYLTKKERSLIEHALKKIKLREAQIKADKGDDNKDIDEEVYDHHQHSLDLIIGISGRLFRCIFILCVILYFTNWLTFTGFDIFDFLLILGLIITIFKPIGSWEDPEYDSNNLYIIWGYLGYTVLFFGLAFVLLLK